MKQKNNEVINIRLPQGMKDQLKQKLGHNLSKIMKEHFQKLLDVKDYEFQNKCWKCHKRKKYNESSFAYMPDEDGSSTIFIFCNDCLSKPELDLSNDPDEMKATLEFVKHIARTNKHPEHLEAFSNLCHLNKEKKIDYVDDTNLCEVGLGTLYLTSEFILQIEEHINGKSTHPHIPGASKLTSIGQPGQDDDIGKKQ